MGDAADTGLSPAEEEELGRLALFHYVLAALTVLLACSPGVYVYAGLAIMKGELKLPIETHLPPEELGRMVVVLAVAAILLGWVHAGVVLVMGRWIAKRQHPLLLMAASGMNCIYVPFGTAVSIYALIVLSRPNIARAFGRT